MINDPRFRDPLYPRDPGLGNNADRPYLDRPEISSGSGRTSLAVAIMLIALLVVGLITFAGPGEDVDPTQTASSGIDQQEEILPQADQPAIQADPAAGAPAAAPVEEEPAPAE